MRTRTAVMIAGLLLATSTVPALAQDENSWGYDKGFFFHTAKFELKISTRTQFRYTYTMTDPNSLTDDNGAFTLPRTRLRLDGYAYYTWLKYKVQYDFTGQTYTTATSVTVPEPVPPATDVKVSLSNKRGPDLRDLYFDITRHPWASVRLGQFKAPFGIQEMTSSGDQEFVDRSIASETFAPSRQQGTMIYGTSYAKKFAYEAGVFNGNARNVATNDNTGYMYVGRIHLDPGGEYKLSETAVDHPDKPIWTIGAAYLVTTTQASLLKTAEELSQDNLEGFFALKYKRLFVLADYYTRTQEQTGVLSDIDSMGAIAQVGFFFVPRKLEVALRWSERDPNTDANAINDKETESRIGFGYFFSKHDLKFQADYGQVKNEASTDVVPPGEEKTDQFRAQLQIVF